MSILVTVQTPLKKLVLFPKIWYHGSNKARKEKENIALQEEISVLKQENVFLIEKCEKLEKENTLLRQDNEKMKRILNNNSSNSSNPPSQDETTKPANTYHGRTWQKTNFQKTRSPKRT